MTSLHSFHQQSAEQGPQPSVERRASGSVGRIAFVEAGWHRDIVERSRLSFVDSLATFGYDSSAVDFFKVPGVFELPLHAKLLAMQGVYTAIVAAGFVVDGGIYRHDFVSQSVIAGLMQVQLETLVPVLSVVLTPHHFHGSEEHVRFFRDHFVIKGAEAARACAEIISKTQKLRQRAERDGQRGPSYPQTVDALFASECP